MEKVKMGFYKLIAWGLIVGVLMACGAGIGVEIGKKQVTKGQEYAKGLMDGTEFAIKCMEKYRGNH